MVVYILGFLACAGVIVYSGTKLSVYADRLATLTGLSRAWLGLVLLASVTSIPELFTALSAVVLVGAPDLTLGNLVGSCAFNIVSVVLVHLLTPARALAAPVSAEHSLTAAFVVLMLCLIGFGFLQPAAFGQVGWVGGYSLVLAGVYLLAIYTIFHYGQKTDPPSEAPAAAAGPGLRFVLVRFSCHALLVMVSALALPYFSEYLAAASGLGQRFFGTFFLSFTTALPEVVVSVSALRLGSLDMALGNLFGSNLFNLFVLALADLFFVAGPLFAHVSAHHLLTVFAAIALTALALVGLITRPARRRRWSIDTVGVLVGYLWLVVLLFRNR